MDTVRIKEFQGMTVVRGFDTRGLDAVATTKAAMGEAAKSVECRNLRIAEGKLSNARKRHAEIKYAYDRDLDIELRNAGVEIDVSYKAYVAKCAELAQEKQVYLELRKGEIQVSPEELASLKKAFASKSKGDVLTIDGQVLVNKVGVRYFERKHGRLVPGKVTAVGETVPEGATLIADLTPELKAEYQAQKELDVIAGMDAEQKATAKAAVLRRAALEAAQERSVLEIQGATAAAALKDSKAAYADAALAIEEKFK